MVPQWLAGVMAGYNVESWMRRNEYAARLHLAGTVLHEILGWAFESLPDEILVGLDSKNPTSIDPTVTDHWKGDNEQEDLYAGQDVIVTEAVFINQGDEFSVHHLPEEWTDDALGLMRGQRASRFLHFLHTHPNAPAIPSDADAEASKSTEGVDLILGLEFSPSGFIPWFDEIPGERRRLRPLEEDIPRRRRGERKRRRVVLGRAKTGHRIHALELIAFHHSGIGVNVIFTDEHGVPYGIDHVLQKTSDA